MQTPDQPHALTEFQYIALYAVEFSSEKPAVVVRVPLVATSPEAAKSEAHDHRYHISRELVPIEVTSIYYNRYGNGQVPATTQAELEQAQLSATDIQGFGSINELKKWLKEQDEAENGHIYDEIQDAREWYMSNPENAHAQEVRRSQDRAIAEGRDFDPDYF